mgnify:CR=1 FL=1
MVPVIPRNKFVSLFLFFTFSNDVPLFCYIDASSTCLYWSPLFELYSIDCKANFSFLVLLCNWDCWISPLPRQFHFFFPPPPDCPAFRVINFLNPTFTPSSSFPVSWFFTCSSPHQHYPNSFSLAKRLYKNFRRAFLASQWLRRGSLENTNSFIWVQSFSFPSLIPLEMNCASNF